MANSFGTVLFPLLVHVRELLEFMPLLARDRSEWLLCLLWHGWLPGLILAGERDAWIAHLGQLAHKILEQVLGVYPADASGFWTPPDFWDAGDLALGTDDHPSVRTDGSREDYPSGGFAVAGAGAYRLPPGGSMRGPSGVLRRNLVMLDWSAAVPLCRPRALSNRFSVLSFGVRFWRCRPSGRGFFVLFISKWSGQLVGYWIMAPFPSLCLWLKMGI